MMNKLHLLFKRDTGEDATRCPEPEHLINTLGDYTVFIGHTADELISLIDHADKQAKPAIYLKDIPSPFVINGVDLSFPNPNYIEWLEDKLNKLMTNNE